MRLAVASAAVFFLSLAAQPVAAQTIDCEADRCAVQNALNTNCPCDSPQFTNHGRYVSCVARTVNGLAKSGTIHTRCKGKVTRCAARSTCGKDAVTCTTNIAGTCTAGACTVGTLAPGLTACATDADCIAGTRCSIKRSADLCRGTAGSGTCCANCP